MIKVLLGCPAATALVIEPHDCAGHYTHAYATNEADACCELYLLPQQPFQRAASCWFYRTTLALVAAVQS